jgi:hypothetical protein
MSKVKADIRDEYRREELGRGVRGKYLKRYIKGTNLVLLDEQVAAAFPDSAAVNDALRGLLEISETTARITRRSGGRVHR